MQVRRFLNYRLKYCWPKVFSTVYVNQKNLNGKLRKKLGGQPKIWGAMAHPGPPLESPLSVSSRNFNQVSVSFRNFNQVSVSKVTVSTTSLVNTVNLICEMMVFFYLVSCYFNTFRVAGDVWGQTLVFFQMGSRDQKGWEPLE